LKPEIIVQKYGGSSVASPVLIQQVAARVAETRREGANVVVVVSAMGKTTDGLLALSRQVTDRPEPRELDLLLSTGETVSSALLAMALGVEGIPAVSLTGPQAGILTDAMHQRARIREVDTRRIHHEIARGKVVVVTGFQGRGDNDEVTTLGRGGSDTSAVALAVALGASACEINTDVDGIYTADPRLCPAAKRLEAIGYEEMLELAQLGAKVMHPRSIELAQLHGIPLVVRSTFSGGAGTTIREVSTMSIEYVRRVRGIAHDLNVAKITVTRAPDRPDAIAALFAPLAAAAINTDVIAQTAPVESGCDISFTVSNDDLPRAAEMVSEAARSIGAEGVLHEGHLAKVSIVGVGVQATPGIAQRMFACLARLGIRMAMIATSEIRITAVIPRAAAAQAVAGLHAEFIGPAEIAAAHPTKRAAALA
jgi:aspartate kinase